MDRQAFGAVASRLSDASIADDATEINTPAAEHVAELLAQAVLSGEGRCPAHDSAAKVSRPCYVCHAGAQQQRCLKKLQRKRNSLCPWKRVGV